MINLEETSGLPIELTDDFYLKFGGSLKKVEPIVRKFSEMTAVLKDPDAKPSPKTDDMYFMYRDVHITEDENVLRQNNIRYDITVTPPIMIGEEFNKTVGHYHPIVPGHTVGFPELYEVISGEALFVIQKMDPGLENLISLMIIPASKGDKIIYPPNYGHIIVNIGTEPLVTGNWVADNFNSLYEPIKARRGMAYYICKEGSGYKLVKNPNYRDHPPVRKLTIADKVSSEFGFSNQAPMYKAGVANPKLLEFLNNPAKYALQLSTITS